MSGCMLDGDTPTMEEFMAMVEKWPSNYENPKKDKDIQNHENPKKDKDIQE